MSNFNLSLHYSETVQNFLSITVAQNMKKIYCFFYKGVNCLRKHHFEKKKCPLGIVSLQSVISEIKISTRISCPSRSWVAFTGQSLWHTEPLYFECKWSRLPFRCICFLGFSWLYNLLQQWHFPFSKILWTVWSFVWYLIFIPKWFQSTKYPSVYCVVGLECSLD